MRTKKSDKKDTESPSVLGIRAMCTVLIESLFQVIISLVEINTGNTCILANIFNILLEQQPSKI